MKHTKGEWNACCLGEGKTSHYIFSDEHCEGTICGMHSNDPRDKHYTEGERVITREERQGNAALIQAAPNMYEALKGLLSDVKQLIGEHDLEPVQMGYMLEAEKALEKAEGKTE